MSCLIFRYAEREGWAWSHFRVKAEEGKEEVAWERGHWRNGGFRASFGIKSKSNLIRAEHSHRFNLFSIVLFANYILLSHV